MKTALAAGLASVGLWLHPGPAAAQPAMPTAVRDASGLTLHAAALTEPLTIDGRLDEPFYREIAPASDFIQVEPVEGAAATERTELWIAYDRNQIYISFRCFESEPDRVVAKEMRRDHTSIWQGDDIVAFIFDTFDDKRNGFQFTLNSLGGRQDAQIANERQWGGDWNTIWTFKTGRFDGGWAAEAAIPFKSLRYQPGDTQVWGFNAFRTNRWRNELSFLKPTTKAMGQRGLLQTSMAAPLHGLVAPGGSKNLEIKPYAIGTGTRSLDPLGGFQDDGHGDVGVDVKYGITANLTADATYNTDFAQVEADQQQINLTRFSLFFPEKREFFLENQGTFQFGTTGSANTAGDTPILFYSRRIGLDGNRVVPIDGGGRVTGRVGRYSIGGLHLQSGREPVDGAPPTGFTVARIRRDLFRRSSVGALVTSRDEHGGGFRSNQVYGVDGTFAFFANLGINTYWARSRTDDADGEISYRAQLDYAGDRYGVQAERLVIDDRFAPGIGYVRRDDIAQSYGLFRFSPRPRNSRRVRKYSMSGSVKYVENTAGRLETREQWTEFAVEFQNADRLFVTNNRIYEFLPAPFPIIPGVVLPVGGYDFDNVQIGFNRAPQHQLAGNLLFERGTFYDGHKTAFSLAGGRVAVTPRISVEPTYSINAVELVEGAFTTHLAGGRLTWTPTPMMFASALLQYNSTSHGLSANVRLRWEYRPGSELFIVLNEERDTAATRPSNLSNRAFIVKVNRLLRF